MEGKRKEKMKTWLIAILLVSLISSFLLFFVGYYKVGFAVGSVFMVLSLSVGQWYSMKKVDDLHRYGGERYRK
ncbi:hypothetical protein [Anoxybacteroides amylolyticum]|uniref:Putative membrane protein n=1 Tax=Anoxybacteroides amylolyticum TaxID=294699 RepID=A0A167T413_9BACL|nr:hypothetical protein [Anoxybacillus amylolyticus]ANB59418.1 putative membrane protein [Anoxybacillus amylolyticus]